MTNGFVTASITNDLASTGYVAQVLSGYATTGSVSGITNIAVNGTTGTVSGGIASVTIEASGISASTATGIAEAVTAPYTNGAVLGATAVQPATLSGYMPTGSAHSTLSSILGSGSLHVSGTETGLIYGALQAEADTPSSIFERSLIRTNPTPLALPNAGGVLMSEIFPYPWGPGWITSAGVTNTLLFGGDDGMQLFVFDGSGGGCVVFDEDHPPTPAQVGADPAGTAAAATNGIDAAFLAGKGGLTNRVFVTPTALACSPTTTITRAMIDAAPWGEMSLSLTGACYLTFDSTVTGTTDVATFGLYITGTNSLTWNTNLLTGTAWTNATATGSDRIFRKASGKATVAVW